MMTITRETSISRELALAILTALDRSEEWDRLNDYYLCWDAEGREYLWLGGDDEPLAENRSTTSWIA